LTAGHSGEIWIAGPMVVLRYWDNPQATVEGFMNFYWKSGDIGKLDTKGFLRVHDRKKDMINRGGYKVFSVEVENCLLAHPAVREAPRNPNGKVLKRALRDLAVASTTSACA
jgi:long-chain acyl-CoA synthetase